VHRGSLDDHESLRAGAAPADGVLHMAFGGDFADRAGLARRDSTAIEALGRPLIGSGRPLVITSGTLAMRAGQVGTEQDAPDPDSIAGFRIPGEQACLGLTRHGVRASVVRLAPTVHGPGDYGFIPMLVARARKTGVSAYIGDGANRWPTVHRYDAAVLFRLTLERAPAGSALHGAGEEGVTLKSIAAKIGAILEVPTVSLTPDEAAAHFENPFMAKVFATDNPVSSARTRALLDWTPTHPTLLEDLEHGDYFSTLTTEH
jgi:nucleoside-diphosphate-sugar epimerase